MTDRPNIVLVTVDSLRADHCSFTGYDRETTPALDRMAADGLVFENAVAPGPSTPESMPAVFTGRDTLDETAGTDVSGARERIDRHLAVRDTIPQRLARRGYATAAFTPNPFTSRYFGFDRGFDLFEDFMGSFVRRRYGRLFDRFLDGTALASVLRIGYNFWRREEVFKPWEDYYGDALAWVESVEEPYFLWVHSMDAHVPYLAPPAYRTQSRWATYDATYRFWRGDKTTPFEESVQDRLVTAYDDVVRYTDAFLERVTSDLDATVVVHGDHGEAFGEHGTYGHEARLYEENVHVPLVVHGGPDRTVRDPVSLRRLPEILVGASEGDVPTDGDPYVLSRTRSGGKTALRGRRLKYIADGSSAELYDLARDERTQVTDESLLAACRRWHRRTDAADRERRAIRAATEQIDEREGRSRGTKRGNGGRTEQGAVSRPDGSPAGEGRDG